MSDIKRIKRGLDIPLEGKASAETVNDTVSTVFAITPDDFPGITWKCVVKPGDKVKAGDALLCDKTTSLIALVSPVAGTVEEVARGERRHILYVSVRKEGAETTKFPEGDMGNEIRETLAKSGLWAYIRQRPYDIVPSLDSNPRDIFVTTFDSAPLAPDLFSNPDFDNSCLEKGLEILSKLTEGKVYLSVRYGEHNISSEFAEVIEFDGPHPAGNVGVQISAVKPVNKGETVWTLDAVTVQRIGKLFTTGIADYSCMVAVTGPEVENPHFVKTFAGVPVKTLTECNLKTDEGIRLISGNVLTGEKVSKDGYLHFPYRQLTVIKEGEDADEFMGWASISPRKFSVKRSFPAFLRGLTKPYGFDARIKGGHRAMILSGEYDKVFPFDIYPEFLLKAIMAKDIDRMEKLGIYEVAPEDFALPEFVDTSKIELQKTVREGLDYLRKELS